MTFITFSLFLGGLLAAIIPILLHWLMRGKPKKYDFPAIRFLKQKFETNRRRFQIRHLLLLFFRVVLLILLGLILARPSLKDRSSNQDVATLSPSLQEIPANQTDLPCAVAFVIDTSVRMNYKNENHTRLEEAQKIALAILPKLPADSQIAVLNSTTDQDSFQIDFLAAQDRIEHLMVQPEERTLCESVLEAIRLLEQSGLSQKKIFILTDQTAAGWPMSLNKRLRQTLERIAPQDGKEPSYVFYLVNVGVESPQNTTLIDLGIATETVPVHSVIRMDAEFRHVGPEANLTAELYLVDSPSTQTASEQSQENSESQENSNTQNNQENLANVSVTSSSDSPNSNDASLADKTSTKETPNSSKNRPQNDSSPTRLAKGETLSGPLNLPVYRMAVQPLSFPAGTSQTHLTFQISDLPLGIHQGFLRLSNNDALSDDNLRWFTLEVQPERKILIVAPDPTDETAIYLQEALAPEELRQTGHAPFDVSTTSFALLDQMSLNQMKEYLAIFLLDPPPISVETTRLLSDFAQQGGGLAFFLGRNANPVSAFQTDEMTALLGGKLATQVRCVEDVFLSPVSYDHPILSTFRTFSSGKNIPWNQLSVFRYWQITDLSNAATVLLTYDDGRAALITQPWGQGTVTVGTTPISDSPNDTPWNLLPVSQASWVFLILMDGIARNLVANDTSLLNYYPYEIATIHWDFAALPDASPIAELCLPDQNTLELALDPQRRQLSFSGTKLVGPYRLSLSDAPLTAVTQKAFSVNYRSSEFDLTPLSDEKLQEYWAPASLHFLKNFEDFDSEQYSSRVNRELFGPLMILLALFLIGEGILSNRFYRQKS